MSPCLVNARKQLKITFKQREGCGTVQYIHYVSLTSRASTQNTQLWLWLWSFLVYLTQTMRSNPYIIFFFRAALLWRHFYHFHLRLQQHQITSNSYSDSTALLARHHIFLMGWSWWSKLDSSNHLTRGQLEKYFNNCDCVYSKPRWWLFFHSFISITWR